MLGKKQSAKKNQFEKIDWQKQFTVLPEITILHVIISGPILAYKTIISDKTINSFTHNRKKLYLG